MGLFRRRAKKNRENAAAEPLQEPTEAAKEPTETAEVPAETAEVPAETAEAPAEVPTEVAPRAVTAEARPNPDQPGWGETIGRQIGQAREGRASQQ
jgi:hypothetical protein